MALVKPRHQNRRRLVAEFAGQITQPDPVTGLMCDGIVVRRIRRRWILIASIKPGASLQVPRTLRHRLKHEGPRHGPPRAQVIVEQSGQLPKGMLPLIYTRVATINGCPF